MSTSDYIFKLYAPTLTELAGYLRATEVEFVNRIHHRGLFRVAFQASEITVPTYETLAADSRFVVWRKPDGMRSAFLAFAGLGRGVRLTQRGQEIYCEVMGYTYNELLARRIVDAAAAAAEADKSGAADDVVKEIVDEQFGSGAATGRDLSGDGFTVQADASAATNIEKEFARRNVLEVLQEIAEQSRSTASTALYWGFVPTGTGLEAEFRTRTGQWGQDLTDSIIFSLGNGNMLNPVYTFDRSEEINYVMGAGSGREENRIEATDQSDTERINASPLNRREYFYDLRNENDTSVIESAMKDILYAGKPERRLEFDVQQTADYRFGVHYKLGDVVRAEFAGIIRDYHIMASMTTLRGGREIIKLVLEER
jgi:hypothetical protein